MVQPDWGAIIARNRVLSNSIRFTVSRFIPQLCAIFVPRNADPGIFFVSGWITSFSSTNLLTVRNRTQLQGLISENLEASIGRVKGHPLSFTHRKLIGQPQPNYTLHQTAHWQQLCEFPRGSSSFISNTITKAITRIAMQPTTLQMDVIGLIGIMLHVTQVEMAALFN